jgi:geranylgeranyl diphosphate synthase type II
MAAHVQHLPSIQPSHGGDEMQIERVLTLGRRIDERLATLLVEPNGFVTPVSQAMRYGVLAPGKRFRPLLLMLSAQALGSQAEHVLDVACAVEMVHAASLFLDDMPCMDDADQRRGQPAVHVVFGQDVAVLSAVALLACASRAVARAPGLPPLVRNEMIAALSDAVGLPGLVTGQYRDLHEQGDSLTTGHVVRTNDGKTGALFAAAFELAGLAAGSSEHVRQLMARAAAELGRAFQLADDLIDAQTDAQAASGKPTLVALVGQEEAQAMLKAHLALVQTLLRTAMPSDTAAIALIHRTFKLA